MILFSTFKCCILYNYLNKQLYIIMVYMIKTAYFANDERSSIHHGIIIFCMHCTEDGTSVYIIVDAEIVD